QSQAKDTVIRKLKDRIKSVSAKHNSESVKKDIEEIETINIELEHSVAKLLSENENLHKEREHLIFFYKDQFDSIKKTRVRSEEHSDSFIAQLNAKSVENSDLKAQLQEKVFATAASNNELRKLKDKHVSDTAVSKPNATTIAPGMFRFDLEKLSPKLLKNRDAHIDYLKNTQEQASILQGIVEQAKPSEKLVATTPLNKNKKVRFADLIKSSSNIQEQVNTHKIQDFNKPLLPSIGVIASTRASGSKPTGNTKKNKIPQPLSSNQNNKVEEHLRKVKFSLYKTNRVSEPVCNANVKHSLLNMNSESICATCNDCLFDANHDMCVLDYVHDVNVRAKSKCVKRNKKRKI
ncbi:hypothetical protein Tco_0885331, partial [Tanacetum coccineum]